MNDKRIFMSYKNVKKGSSHNQSILEKKNWNFCQTIFYMERKNLEPLFGAD